jgi:hypothetical protein
VGGVDDECRVQRDECCSWSSVDQVPGRAGAANTLAAGLYGRCPCLSVISPAGSPWVYGHMTDRHDHKGGDWLDNRRSGAFHKGRRNGL